MNIKDLHVEEKAVQAVPLFKGEGTSLALHLAAEATLKAHTTPIPALLLCVKGGVIFEDMHGHKIPLAAGDFVHIPPHVLHWVYAEADSHLVLFK